jgi:hypothetical protein
MDFDGHRFLHDRCGRDDHGTTAAAAARTAARRATATAGITAGSGRSLFGRAP